MTDLHSPKGLSSNARLAQDSAWRFTVLSQLRDERVTSHFLPRRFTRTPRRGPSFLHWIAGRGTSPEGDTAYGTARYSPRDVASLSVGCADHVHCLAP